MRRRRNKIQLDKRLSATIMQRTLSVCPVSYSDTKQDYGVQIRMTTMRLLQPHSLLVFTGEIVAVKACVQSRSDMYVGYAPLIRNVAMTATCDQSDAAAFIAFVGESVFFYGVINC